MSESAGRRPAPTADVLTAHSPNERAESRQEPEERDEERDRPRHRNQPHGQLYPGTGERTARPRASSHFSSYSPTGTGTGNEKEIRGEVDPP